MFVFIFFLLIFPKTATVQFISGLEDNQVLSAAVESLISKFFLQKYSNLNVFKVNDFEVNQIATNFLRSSGNRFTVNIRNMGSKTMRAERKKFLSLVLMDTVKAFKGFQKLLNTTFSKSGFFLLVVLKSDSQDLDETFNVFWNKKFYNVNFLVGHRNSTALLVTFSPFSERKCEKPLTKTINSFDMTTRKWSNTEFFPNKFKNLHKCKIVHETTFPSVINKSDGSFRGKEVEIIDVLGEILNFTAEHRVIKSFGNISKNGSGSGVLKNLYDQKIQITSGSLQLERTILFSESSPFFSDPLLLIIPPPCSFSSLQKLYKAFSIEVWAGIILVLVVLLILNQYFGKTTNWKSEKTHQNFVSNIFSTFIGGSLPNGSLPEKNSIRFVFACFLIYSLIIRTAYTGVLFKFLQSDLKHKEFKSVDEIDDDYTFYAFESMYDRIVDFRFYNK
jgi:hypothetical protein